MEKYDWLKILKYNILSLKFVGLWPASDHNYQCNFYTLWSFLVITMFTFGHTLSQVINLIFIFDDLGAVVQTFYVTIAEIAVVVKIYYVIKNMTTLKELMITLRSDIFQPRNKNKLECLNRITFFGK